MTIKIKTYEIPNTISTSSGDTFNLNIYRGAKFMTVDVILDTPYLVFIVDDAMDTVQRTFVYANSTSSFPSRDAVYLGKYTTIVVPNSFYICEWY